MAAKVPFWVVLVALAIGCAGGYFVGRQSGPVVRVETDAGESLEKATEFISRIGENAKRYKEKKHRRRQLVACRLLDFRVEDTRFGQEKVMTIEYWPVGIEKPVTGLKVEFHIKDQFGDDRTSAHARIERRVEPSGLYQLEVRINSFESTSWMERLDRKSLKMECEVLQVVYEDGTVQTY